MRRPLSALRFAGCLLTLVPSVAWAQAAKAAPARKPAPKPKTTAGADAAAEKAPLPPLLLPPPPPPWPSPGVSTTSTSGATLLPDTPQAPVAVVAPVPETLPPLTPTDRASLEARIRMLEQRLAVDENALLDNPELSWLRRFHLSGYIQPQILIQSYNTAASPNLVNGSLPAGVSANAAEAKSNGTTTNGDFFRLRRARLKTEFMPSEGTRLVFEFDPTPAGGTIGGTGTIARQVEAQGIAKWNEFVSTEFAAGVFKLPFGYEVLQSDADRPFIERSWGEQNLTPGEFDTGARMYTAWRRAPQQVVVQLALVNGQTEGEPTFSLDPDLNAAKDGVGRINFDFGDWFDVGASGYYGKGQVVDAAGLRFKQFQRWAANGELGLHHTFSKSVGATKIFAEVTFGENMDRGVHYSFALPSIPMPVTRGVVYQDERSVWVRLEQDLSRWATLGLRWDEYTPNTGLSNDARDTFGVVGVAHFTSWLQLMLEYDHAIDHVHPAGTVYADKQIETGSGVLQGRF